MARVSCGGGRGDAFCTAAQRRTDLPVRGRATDGVSQEPSSSIAARPEIATDTALIAEEEPGLVNLALVDREGSDASLAPMWEGRELYRMENTSASGIEIVRAYVPVHNVEGLRSAWIELASPSADFLSEHAATMLRRRCCRESYSSCCPCTYGGQHGARSGWNSDRRGASTLRTSVRCPAVLAHESRNPLGTVEGFAHWLYEQTGEADQS